MWCLVVDVRDGDGEGGTAPATTAISGHDCHEVDVLGLTVQTAICCAQVSRAGVDGKPGNRTTQRVGSMANLATEQPTGWGRRQTWQQNNPKGVVLGNHGNITTQREGSMANLATKQPKGCGPWQTWQQNNPKGVVDGKPGNKTTQWCGPWQTW